MKPILFNTEMVYAIIDGRKTVTRRLVKFEGGRNPNWTGYIKDGLTLYNGRNEPCNKPAPYQANDVLYVRETWMNYFGKIMYKADCDKYRIESLALAKFNWVPSIHMPKEAARIFLRVTDVKLERLQDITEEQALKEGCQASSCEFKGAVWGQEDTEEWTATENFIDVWQSTIHKKLLDTYGWKANPYVWVIEFEVITKEQAFAAEGGH